MTYTTRTKLAGAALSALLLASCAPEKAPEPQDKDQTTVRWIPSAAVDLMSTEATFVRAATESFVAAWTGQGRTGVDAIRNSGYPGFEHAFNNIGKTDDFGAPGRNVYLKVGTMYTSIIGLTHQGDRYVAEVCTDSRHTASQRDDGKYAMNYLADSVGALQVTFGPDPKLPADQQHAPLAKQKGPAERPADNVFGTWVLFDYRTVRPVSPQCSSFAPDTPAEDPETSLRIDPPQTLPPDPGWPEGSKA
ncbi:hypothetical protein [Mycobacteroides abscessus]|uniref:hypothetical protein n=1 Tax=Mycobacteroides abscessus TaxID=36809 RepID=UPI000C2597B2|nr:hypothetical protein [Mycobacteroides abscessus]RIS59123.1 hypothetical protein D2E46_07195 [Mycobacteroides abscessus]